MEKQLKDKEVFHKTNETKPIPFSAIDIELKPNDFIYGGYEEPFYGSDSAHDGYYYLIVSREVLETDEEFEKRKKSIELEKKWAKERRHEYYLKLKKEFENE